MHRTTLEVGCLVRRQIRRFLMKQNIQFSEDKGLLDSLFLITVNDEQLAMIMSIVKANA